MQSAEPSSWRTFAGSRRRRPAHCAAAPPPRGPRPAASAPEHPAAAAVPAPPLQGMVTFTSAVKTYRSAAGHRGRGDLVLATSWPLIRSGSIRPFKTSVAYDRTGSKPCANASAARHCPSRLTQSREPKVAMTPPDPRHGSFPRMPLVCAPGPVDRWPPWCGQTSLKRGLLTTNCGLRPGYAAVCCAGGSEHLLSQHRGLHPGGSVTRMGNSRCDNAAKAYRLCIMRIIGVALALCGLIGKRKEEAPIPDE